ncbi:MAG: endonuclease V [Candidatus Aramenus sp.]|nr:endonuclease V [Candidatus Aramenus sp.]
MDYVLNFLRLLQQLIAKNVVIEHFGLENARSICGVDVAYKGEEGIAVAVRFDGNSYQHNVVKGKVDFPYIPGYLFMREAPIMLKALEGLSCDLILVDGHGIAHPRKSGIATVIGVLLEAHTMGVAKSKLVGDVVEEGGVQYVVVNGEKVGVKAGKYYYSPGNKTDLQDALDLSMRGYPEVLRVADKLSKELKR